MNSIDESRFNQFLEGGCRPIKCFPIQIVGISLINVTASQGSSIYNTVITLGSWKECEQLVRLKVSSIYFIDLFIHSKNSNWKKTGLCSNHVASLLFLPFDHFYTTASRQQRNPQPWAPQCHGGLPNDSDDDHEKPPSRNFGVNPRKLSEEPRKPETRNQTKEPKKTDVVAS